MRLNTKNQINTIKKLILDNEWVLQVVHSTGVSLFSLRNYRSRLMLPEYEDFCAILRNPCGDLLVCADFRIFVEIHSKSQYIKRTVRLDSKLTPKIYLRDSFVICQTKEIIHREEKLFLNIDLSHQSDEQMLKSTKVYSLLVLNLRRTDQHGHPQRDLIYRTQERISCFKLVEARSNELIVPEKHLQVYDVFVVLESFVIEKVRVILDCRERGSAEILNLETILSMSRNVLRSITDAHVRGKCNSKVVLQNKSFENTIFSIQEMVQNNSHSLKSATSLDRFKTDHHEIAINSLSSLCARKNFQFEFCVDDVHLFDDELKFMFVLRVKNTLQINSYVSYFDFGAQQGSSFMIPFIKWNKLSRADQFTIRAMTGSSESRFFVFGRLGVVVFALSPIQSHQVEIRSYRSFKDQKHLSVEYLPGDGLFFIMSDFKIEIWNEDFSLRLHTLSSISEFKKIFLNVERRKLLIYCKLRYLELDLDSYEFTHAYFMGSSGPRASVFRLNLNLFEGVALISVKSCSRI